MCQLAGQKCTSLVERIGGPHVARGSHGTCFGYDYFASGGLHRLALRCPERAARYIQLAKHHEEMAKMVEVTT